MCQASFEADKLYPRVTELDDGRSLSVYQSEVGDVGCVVWDAAIVLAKFYEHIVLTNQTKYASTISGEKDAILHNSMKQLMTLIPKLSRGGDGYSVVELGSGTGYVGIVAAAYGSQVTITDLPEFVDLMMYNVNKCNSLIEEKGGRCNASALVWGTDSNVKADLILLSDCIYYKESLSPLVKTLLDISKPESLILCCHEERTTDNKPMLQQQFFEEVGRHFSVVKVPSSLQHPTFNSDDIHINILQRKVS